jgi:fibronectin-binding autotransporter adhesin
MLRFVQTRPSETGPTRGLRRRTSVLPYRSVVVGVLIGIAATGGVNSAWAQSSPAPASNSQISNTQLPTGGQVSAGQANISQSGNTLNVNQSSQRAVVDWNSFNVGKDAQVNFQQPNAQSSTLNRVSDMQPSQIFGRIVAPGQVVLVNPQGVYFGKTSSVDVGGLVATTHTAVADEYMKGQLKFNRNGATGAVVNEGELRAALGGYIALLAPEVRNQGLIVANLGTVALAAGDAYELQFDGQGALSNVRVTPATLNTLVENKQAIQAPGGFVIMSAQAASRMQSAVVSNAGRIEATGLVSRAGRILLEATTKVLNSGLLSVNAGSDGSPAGNVQIKAPLIENSGTISATNLAAANTSGNNTAANLGHISIEGEQFTQTASGVLDVSALNTSSGNVTLQVSDSIYMSGSVLAISTMGSGQSANYVLGNAIGGQINLQATRRIDFDGAVLDASGPDGAGRVHINATGAPADSGNNTQPVHGVVAMANNTVMRVNSQRAQAGRVEVEGDDISLNTGTLIEAKGSTGGGTVLVGGDWQGSGTMRQATTVSMSADSTIDASATDNGDGGKVVLWSDVRNASSFTYTAGNLFTLGAGTGKGGRIETSGAVLTVFGTVQAGNDGLWLLDPLDIYVGDSYGSVSSSILSSGYLRRRQLWQCLKFNAFQCLELKQRDA